MLANIGNVRVSQSARIALGGNVIPTHQVMYTIGDQGPFTDAFADSQYSPQNVYTIMAARMVKLYHLGVTLPYPPKQVGTNPNTWQIPLLPNPGDVAVGSAALAPTGVFTYVEPPTT